MNMTQAMRMKERMEPNKKVLPLDCSNRYIMLYKMLSRTPNKNAALNPLTTKYKYHVIKPIHAIAAIRYAQANA